MRVRGCVRAFAAAGQWDREGCAALLSPGQRERVEALAKSYWLLDGLEQAYALRLVEEEAGTGSFGVITVDKDARQFLHER